MATANDLISGALRTITSLAPGEAIPGAESDNALMVLNTMMAAWGAAGGMNPSRTLENFAIPAGTQSRTIGVGGQLNTARPDRVTDAYLRDASNVDFSVDVTMTSAEYNALPLKNIQARPLRMFFDPQYPVAELYFDRITDASYTLFIESFKPFPHFSSLSAQVILPGEYEEGTKYLLAERLAIEYGFPISNDLRKLINDAKKVVLRKNTTLKAARFDVSMNRYSPVNFTGRGVW